MPVSIEELRSHLLAFDFPRLFVEGLGWNHYQAEPVVVLVNDREYSLKPVAEKTGFAVYECDSSVDNNIPQYPIRRKIESEVAKRTFEHLIIFTGPSRKAQVWQWVKRETGKPAVCQEIPFLAGQSGEHLLQRIQPLFVSLEEESSLNIALVASRVRAALDVEKVTKRFYDRFSTELTAFGKFIDGITVQGGRDWYASLMLNRMMFVYFVQKQGFLDGDFDYLRNRLSMVRNQSGDGRFQQFYRIFLLRLFHEGLGKPEAQRAPDLAALLGKVPFLNGGLFDVHDLERDNPNISISDAAFERVFDFFDSYRWHLDERPYREDNEINPDVLGYIFEKYVNQKQMGAYYTKEDITGYISRNTVIPFLFDAAKKECPVAFGPDGGVWRLLRDDPDRYIYPAVAHGIAWDAHEAENPTRLNSPFELPDEIAVGIDDSTMRGGWNNPASEEHGLPTETWREVVARRKRYAEVRSELASGKVQDVDALVTLNLDIERFAGDVIAQSEGAELLRAFWHALRDIAVLDPTCGSGAFLFAALNVLEPFYTACLEGMRGFLDDAERSERKRSPKHLEGFQKVLDEADEHPSERYFILKSIVLNNLYGVDIMEEAVEICKLRLFLKLVAQLKSYEQIEPLPDIDFNVRAGNTLVGFTSLEAVRLAMTIMPNGQHRTLFDQDRAALARIEQEARGVDSLAHDFKRQQTMLGGEVTSADKQALRVRLGDLADELDSLLASEYGVDPADPGKHNVNPKNRKDKTRCDRDLSTHDVYACWRASHQPFHWFVEFYGIMSKGGFDVVIGNPPYVEYSKVKSEYAVKAYKTEPCGNLYAFVVERNKGLCSNNGRTSMIVPHSAICTDRMAEVQTVLFDDSVTWSSTYDIRPSKLFEGVDQRLCIYVTRRGNGGTSSFTSRYHRWHEGKRPTLLQHLEYVDSTAFGFTNSIPKMDSLLDSKVLAKLKRLAPLGLSLSGRRGHTIYYHNAPRYWVRATDFAPYFWNERNGEQISTQVKSLSLTTEEDANAVVAALNSSLFYWWFLLLSDSRHLNLREIESFPLGLKRIGKSRKQRLAQLTDELMESFKRHSQRKETRYKATGKVVYDEFDQKPAKPIVDRIDRVLAEHYGFTDEELDFIINYDIKYRMGREV